MFVLLNNKGGDFMKTYYYLLGKSFYICIHPIS